jgi:hypothetical protein
MYGIHLAPLAGSCEHVVNICFHKRLVISDQPGDCQLLRRTRNSIDIVGIAVGCYLLVVGF